MRRANRLDSNHQEIVTALRASGVSVQPLVVIGQGCPDILVGFAGHNFLLELKDGDKSPSRRELTPDQIRWHQSWRGQVLIVTSVAEASVAEALAIIGVEAQARTWSTKGTTFVQPP